jgi:hypothetical protein
MNDMFGIKFVESTDGYCAFHGLSCWGPRFRGDALGSYIASLWDFGSMKK